METGKTTRYFKYAIGEIILVVIGILIALQINNWNQNRVNSNKEKLLLSELNKEFKENKIQFQEVLEKHKKALNATNYIVRQFPIDLKKIDLDTFYTKAIEWRYTYTFNPSQGVIKSLINSSSFEIITNNELRKLLISWEDVLVDYQEEEILAKENFYKYCLPQFTDKISFVSFKDKRNDISFLSTVEYENVVLIRQGNLMDILESETGELDKVIKTINLIIKLSEPNNHD